MLVINVAAVHCVVSMCSAESYVGPRARGVACDPQDAAEYFAPVS